MHIIEVTRHRYCVVSDDLTKIAEIKINGIHKQFFKQDDLKGIVTWSRWYGNLPKCLFVGYITDEDFPLKKFKNIVKVLKSLR